MKNFFIILALFFTANCLAQDRIIKSNGDTLDCKITSIDSSKVYIEAYSKGQLIQSSIPISETKAIFNYSNSNGNTTNSPILYSKDSGSWRYYYNGVSFKKKNLGNLIKNDPVANKKFQEYKTTRGLIDVLVYAGSFSIGWSLGQVISGKEVNPYLLGAGVGLCLISIPIYSSSTKSLHESIDIYNDNSVPKKPSNIAFETSFGIKNGLASFTVTF